MSQAVIELTHLAPTMTVPVLVQQEQPQEKKAWTADDLLALADDENRYEIVRGELMMMTPASVRHGKFASRLDRALGGYVEGHALGEVYTAEPGFQLEAKPLTIRAPGVAFVRRERIPPQGSRKASGPSRLTWWSRSSLPRRRPKKCTRKSPIIRGPARSCCGSSTLPAGR